MFSHIVIYAQKAYFLILLAGIKNDDYISNSGRGFGLRGSSYMKIENSKYGDPNILVDFQNGYDFLESCDSGGLWSQKTHLESNIGFLIRKGLSDMADTFFKLIRFT